MASDSMGAAFGSPSIAAITFRAAQGIRQATLATQQDLALSENAVVPPVNPQPRPENSRTGNLLDLQA